MTIKRRSSILSIKRTRILFYSLIAAGLVLNFVFAVTAQDYVEEGNLYVEQERYYDAIDSYKSAIEKNAYYGDAYRNLSEVYYLMEDYDLALEQALDALKYSHQDEETMLLVGNCYRELGEYDSAEDYYNDILDLHPSSESVYRNLGELYMKMNRYDDAFTMLKKALRLEPDAYKNYLTLGDYYYQTGNMDSAEENYQLAFEMESRNRETYYELANYYYNTGDYDEAVVLLSQGNTLFENFVSGITLLGDCYLELEQYDDALEMYQWLEDSDTKFSAVEWGWLYFKMALCYETTDTDEAIDYYEESLDDYPDNQLCRFSFEKYVIDQFELDDELRAEIAVEYYDKALDRYGEGDVEEYLFDLKRAVFLNPFYEDARQELVDYYELTDDYFHAYNELEILFRINSSYTIKNKIEKYDWKIDNGTLILRDNDLFEFNGLFLSDESYYNLSDVFSDRVEYHSGNYDKVKLSVSDYRKNEGVNSKLALARKDDYHFIVATDLDAEEGSILFELYDQSGEYLDQKLLEFDVENLEGVLHRFYSWLDEFLPDIGYVSEKMRSNQYRISVGTKNGYEKDDQVRVFNPDKESLDAVALLKITTAGLYSSECTVVSNYLSTKEKMTDYAVIGEDFATKKDLTKLKRILLY